MKRLDPGSWLLALTAAGTAAASGYLHLAPPHSVPEFLAGPLAWVLPAIAGATGGALLFLQITKRRKSSAAPVGLPTGSPTGPNSEQTASQTDAEIGSGLTDLDVWDNAIGALSDLTLRLDAKGRVRYASRGATRLLAMSSADLIGTSLLEYLPTSAVPDCVKAFKAARQHPGEVFPLTPLRLSAGAPSQQNDEASSVEPRQGQTPTLRLQLVGLTDGSLLVMGMRTAPAAAAKLLALSDAAEDDRFSRIFHSSPDAIIILHGANGTLIDFNPGFTQVVGYSREQAIGVRDLDLGLWADPDEWKRTLQDLRQHPSDVTLETRMQASDGTLKPVEMSLRYIELNGELHILCIARDISKRIEAESAARHSEEKFSRVFSQSPDGIIIVQQQGLIICDVNTAFCQSSGYSRDELLGKPIGAFDAFVEPQDLAEATAILTEHGHLSNRDIVLRNKSGQQVPALLSATLIDLDDTPCVLCIAKDVSELREAEGRLQASEQRFRGAFENAPIGIVLLDTRGYIFEANRFANALLEYPEEALNGLHISRLLPAEDRADLKAQLDGLIQAREVTVYNERRLLCASGLEIWANCHMVLQRDADDQPSYCILQIADITEMKTNQRRMERMAFFDTLTELANRRLFNDRLRQSIEHCLRSQQRGALLYLDLDQFKRVNDTLGHEAGDELLREVAERLLGCVRKEDTVGRPGGDEFTILLYEVRSPADAGQVAEKILNAMRQPIAISGHQLVVTTSIGIALLPDDGVDANMLLKNADLAMYRAKEQGRNNFQFYSEDLNTNAVKRLRTEYELRRALERSEFELYYQPKIRLIDQELVGVECLIRWQHPERGLISPDGFIEIAEETGDIVEIGNWVLQEACAAGRLLVEQQGSPAVYCRQHFPAAVPGPEPRSHHPALSETSASESCLPRVGDHRNHADARRRRGIRNRASPSQPRYPPGDRRFRHGVLVFKLPEEVSHRHRQGGQKLRHGHSAKHGRQGHYRRGHCDGPPAEHGSRCGRCGDPGSARFPAGAAVRVRPGLSVQPRRTIAGNPPHAQT